MGFNRDLLKKMFSSKRILLVLLFISLLIVLVSVYIRSYTSNSQSTPTFYLSYPRNFAESSASSDRFETCQYILSHGNWESWKQPVIEVTFKKDPSGTRTIYQCSAYIIIGDGNISQFKITDQQIKIDNQSVDVTLIGHLAQGTSRSNEQVVSFKVYFLQDPKWHYIFTSEESTVPIIN